MILFRYLTKEIFTTMVAVTVVLLMIMMSNWLIRLLGPAAAGKETLEVVLLTLVYRLPYFLEMILPLAFFLSVMLTYGRMYAESEMTILTATGTSDAKLLGMTMLPASLVMIVVGTFSLYLSPQGAQARERLYSKQLDATSFELIAPGRFQHFNRESRVNYVERVSGDKQTLYGVFIADGDELVLAKSASKISDEDSGARFLQLARGHRYRLNSDNASLEAFSFERYAVQLSEPKTVERRLRAEAIDSRQLLSSDGPKERSQLHWRISLIIMIPIATLVAFAMSKVNPRQGRFARLLPAFALFAVYLSLMISFTSLIKKEQVDGAWPIWLLHSVFALLGSLLVAKPALIRRFKAWKAGAQERSV